MPQMAPVMTIDGPSGAGKGTLCQLLAEKLGWHLLDSGAIYRVLALAALHHDVELDAEAALVPLAANLDVQFQVDGGQVKVVLEGEDVSRTIRSQEVSDAASKVAVFPRVREALLGGFASSKILEVHAERMIKRTFDPGFRISLHQKDLNLALSSARQLGVSLPNTAQAQELFNSCVAHGGANWDHSGMVRALEIQANFEVGQKVPA